MICHAYPGCDNNSNASTDVEDEDKDEVSSCYYKRWGTGWLLVDDHYDRKNSVTQGKERWKPGDDKTPIPNIISMDDGDNRK